ncbi:unnamed protein product [Discosporangium mesarthrocarpum]
MWRKEGDGNNRSYHEIDLSDIKTVEAKGRLSLVLSSRTGDLLLELEAEESETRDKWVWLLPALPFPRGPPPLLTMRVFFSRPLSLGLMQRCAYSR